MRNLIIADKQDITSAGIKYLISQRDDVGDVFVAESKSGLINLLSDNADCLIILDYTLFDFSSINELQILNERYPESSWILFSDELTDTFLRQMIAHNLMFSIIFKVATLDEIQSAIDSSLLYDRYLDKNVESHLRALSRTFDDSADHNLTVTEKEILKEIALGRTTKEIATGRNLSFHTVMTHRKNIFRKLEVNNAHEATKYAMRAGIVDLSEYYI